MKNSKKGFTLVELVVVIAILAILAAIAIPVVSNTINSSKISGANSDAQTLELALKEADAQIVAGDKSVYSASADISAVCASKGIRPADSVTIKGSDYYLVWDFKSEKCYYALGATSASNSGKTGTASAYTMVDGTSATIVPKTITYSNSTQVASLFK